MANNIKVTFYDDVRIQQNINETNMALPANGGVFSDGGIYFTPAEEIGGANVPAHIVHKNYIYTLGSYVTTQTDIKGTLTTDNAFNVVTNVESKPYNRELIVTKTPLVIEDKWSTNITALTNKITKLADGETHEVQIGSDKIYLTIAKDGTLTFTSETTLIKVESIDIPKSIELYGEGAETTLTATVKPASASNKTVTWSSNNTSIATVNAGKVTTVGKGNSTITVAAIDGSGVKNTCDVTVKEARITSIKADNITTTYGNASSIYVKPVVTINNGDGKLFTDTFSYTVTNGDICSINSKGYLGIIKPGETTATVTADADESYSYTFNIKINKANNKITVSYANGEEITGKLIMTYSPETYYLTATGNGDRNEFTWSSSNVNSVHIGKNSGEIKMNKSGSGKITVSTEGNDYYGNASKDIEFQINKANAQISVQPDTLEFELGSTETKRFIVKNHLDRNIFSNYNDVSATNSYVNFSQFNSYTFDVTLKNGANVIDKYSFNITADTTDKYLGSSTTLYISITQPATPEPPATNYYWYVGNSEDIVKGDLAAGDIDWTKAQQVTSFDELNYSTGGTKLTMANSGNNSVYILCPKSWSNKWQFWNVNNDIDLTTGFQEVGAILEMTFIKNNVEYDLWWLDGYYGNIAHMRKK